MSQVVRFFVALPLLAPSCGCLSKAPTQPRSVDSVEQAMALAQQFEREMNDELYGAGAQHPLLASSEEPFAVVEEEGWYVLEFRRPFAPQGGGYIKAFRVEKVSGRVTRGTWILGR